MRICLLASAMVMLLGTMVPGKEPELVPYVKPEQMKIPEGKRSLLMQPWRAYVETVPGTKLLNGVGIYYKHVPHNADHDAVIGLLAECGFSFMRIAPHANIMPWDGNKIGGRGEFLDQLRACKKHGIRPQMVLIGHAYQPCPIRRTSRKLVKTAAKGAREITLDSVDGLVERYSGISTLTDYVSAEVIFTDINPKTNVVKLSRPLPKEIKAGGGVSIATLKTLPLYPVGTKEYEATVEQMLKYENAVLDWLDEVGIDVFNLELWAGLEWSGGRKYVMGINEYYDPPLFKNIKAPLEPGGHAFELGSRMAALGKKRFPKATVVWNFTNYEFYTVNMAELPKNVDAITWSFYDAPPLETPKNFPPKGAKGYYIEQPLPKHRLVLTEGWAHLFAKGPSLMPVLAPEARARVTEARKGKFGYYTSALGFQPRHAGITDAAKAHELKAKFAARALLFWLNKGLDGVLLHSAYEPGDEANWTILYSRLAPSAYGKYPKEKVMSPVLKIVKNITREFKGSTDLAKPRQLQFSVSTSAKAADPNGNLTTSDVLAILPYQIDKRRFIVAVYIMTPDITVPVEDTFTVRITGVAGKKIKTRYYDPLADKELAAKAVSAQAGSVTFRLPVADYPRLLIIEEKR
ncbi:MAG: hypothetical protein QGD94_03450 [Planctomycetia bacterium]|nr:hypothetical protein [Planctomycetia bacterium]